MGKKIAIIATDFLEQFIKDMITELDMGFQYHIFTYEKFEDIKDIYKKIGQIRFYGGKTFGGIFQLRFCGNSTYKRNIRCGGRALFNGVFNFL